MCGWVSDTGDDDHDDCNDDDDDIYTTMLRTQHTHMKAVYVSFRLSLI